MTSTVCLGCEIATLPVPETVDLVLTLLAAIFIDVVDASKFKLKLVSVVALWNKYVPLTDKLCK